MTHSSCRAVLLFGLIIVLGGGLAASGQAAAVPSKRVAPRTAPAPMKSIGTVKEIMTAMTIPASNAVFEAASEPPKSDAQWAAAAGQALALAESANLLMMSGRAVDRGVWMTRSREQLDAAVAAWKAAKAKDADALSTASDALYETCAGCHKTYMPAK